MKTAVVTGATRGIGRATAVALARRGYDVAVTGRTLREGDVPLAGSLESVSAEIEAHGQRAVPIVLDLLAGDALAPAAASAVAGLGHVDVVLNNAIYVGPAGNSRFLETPREEIERRIYGDVTAQLAIEHPAIRCYNLQPGRVVTERVLAAGADLAFVARRGAAVDIVGETMAGILDAPPATFASGSTIEVQDVARSRGLLD